MARRIERKRRKAARPMSVVGAGLYALDRVLALAAAAVVIAIFYLLAGLVSGAIAGYAQGPPGRPPSPADQAHILGSVRTALYAFMGGMWFITLVSIFRFRENDVAGYVGGLGGALCYFGLPWLVRAAMMQHHANPNAASDLMLAGLRATGKVLLLMTAVYFAGKTVVRFGSRVRRARSPVPIIIERPAPEPQGEVVNAPAAAGGRKAAAPQVQPARRPRPTLLKQCWELSLCRDTLRDNCPSYKLHTTCWKRGTGCQCDPTLAQRLIEDLELRLHGELPDNERLARERMKEQLAYRLATHEGGAYCRECPVYGEHQHHKYRAFYWIAYPITAGLIVLLLPMITRVYHWLDKTVAAMLSSLSMLPHSEETLRPLMQPFMTTVYTFNGEYIFIASIALMIAAYLLDLVDYAVFQAKI